MIKLAEKNFQIFILNWYRQYGRHDLPWRHTTNPYHILVSEVMLQQTQVERVIPKYQAFLQSFPTPQALAAASLAQVLKLWQGLGYNRRAKFLHQAAQAVIKLPNHAFPNTLKELEALPGVGPYTASALMTFTYNQPIAVIETNVRTVFLHHFFPESTNVTDAELLPLVTKTLYTPNPRSWYSALMDYGSYLKKTIPNPSRRSKHHTRQSTFKGSLRQVRGDIIRALTQHSQLTSDELQDNITGDHQHFSAALEQLIQEKIVIRKGSSFSLPGSP